MKKFENIQAIIFDKDGTLLDFDAFWVAVSQKAIEDVLCEFGAKKELSFIIAEALGVHNGITDIDGILCKGTYKQIGEIVCDILSNSGYKVSPNEVVEAIVRSYNKNINAGEIKPTCDDLIDVLMALKKRNKKLAVVTTDNEQITRQCLKVLGIEEIFDQIYTDDGKMPTKPSPNCAWDFCKRYNIAKEKVVMVGDTLTDVSFAKNAGIAMIGFAKSEKNKEKLIANTGVVVSEMIRLLEIVQ